MRSQRAQAPGLTTISPTDEHELMPAGFLTFVDPPKADAAESIERLEQLGIAVKIVTGDNELVAQKVCRDLGRRRGRDADRHGSSRR